MAESIRISDQLYETLQRASVMLDRSLAQQMDIGLAWARPSRQASTP
jgi:hypothetical protein